MMRAASTAPGVLAPEHRLDEPWHREQKDRQRDDEHQRRGNERVLPHTLEHALSSAVLPGPRLLGEEDEARGGAGRGEAGLRRLGDPEEADLCRSATIPSTSGTSVVRSDTTPVPRLDCSVKEMTSRRSVPRGWAGADGKRRKAASPTAETATVAIA